LYVLEKKDGFSKKKPREETPPRGQNENLPKYGRETLPVFPFFKQDPT
jgi:hypothetical protein